MTDKLPAVSIPGPTFTVYVSAVDVHFPFGGRGARPFRFVMQRQSDVDALKEMAIPGVLVKGREARCAADAVQCLCEHLGSPGLMDAELERREKLPVPMPGVEKWEALGLNKLRRDYQAAGIRYLARRAYSILGDCPRAGKTLMFLGVHVLTGSPKTLIICPALAKYVWTEEVAKWIDVEAVLLFGRGGDDARVFCKACRGRGEIEDVKCVACDGEGERSYLVRDLEPDTGTRWWNEEPTDEDVQDFEHEMIAWWSKNNAKQEKWRANEQARRAKWEAGKQKRSFEPKPQPAETKAPEPPKGKRRGAAYSVWPPVFRCKKHVDFTCGRPGKCRLCRDEMMEVLEAAEIVVTNYDILLAQKDKTTRGVEFVRTDLPGWGPVLAQLNFSLVGLDEVHKIRGFALGNQETKTQSRRERVNDVCERIPQIIGISGTPMMGFVRDLFSQLDVLSGGLWS